MTIKTIEKTLEMIGLQWTYILVSPDFPWCVKVGWSASFDARICDIRYTMSREEGREIRVWCILKMPMFWAKRAEDSIHSWPLFKYLKVTSMKGSGRTEWARIVNIYCAGITYFACCYFDYYAPEWPTIFVLVFPLAFDYIFFLITIAALQYGFVGIICYALWNTFF
jgi:hypothetical protein